MLGDLYRAAHRILPSRISAKLNLWKPATILDSTFRIPILGSVQLPDAHLRATWKTVVIQRLATSEDELLLDIGTNIGQTLLDYRAANSPATYIGFEPNPMCVNYLLTLIRINGWDDCRVVPVGLAATSGIEKLHVRPYMSTDGLGSLVDDFEPGHVRNAMYVPVFPLDAIRPSLPPQPVGFVKIDVERAEIGVLRGMQEVMERERPTILCEILFARRHQTIADHGKRKTELMDLLRRVGYSAFQIIKTSDQADVAALEEIRSFPLGYQNAETRDLCDYLFLPREVKKSLAERIF